MKTREPFNSLLFESVDTKYQSHDEWIVSPSSPTNRDAGSDVKSTEAKIELSRRERRRILLIIVLTIVLCVLAVSTCIGLLVFFYTSSVKNSAELQGRFTIHAAFSGAEVVKQRIIRTVEQNIKSTVRKRLLSYPDWPSDADDASDWFNTVLFPHLASQYLYSQAADAELQSMSVAALYPRAPNQPPQSADQAGCPFICARPGDPIYSSMAYVKVYYDKAGKQYIPKWQSTQRGSQNYVTEHDIIVENDRFATINKRPTTKPAVNLMNDLKNGSWNLGFVGPPTIVSFSDGTSAYSITYTHMFTFNDYSIVATASILLERFFRISNATYFRANSKLIITSADLRVLASSYNNYGDVRLKDCSEKNCEGYNAENSPNSLVRAVFKDSKEIIIKIATNQTGKSFDTHWAKLDGSWYFVMIGRLTKDTPRSLVLINLVERDVLYRDLLKTIALSILAVFLLVILVAGVSSYFGWVGLKRNVQTTIVMAHMAQFIASYNVAGAEKFLKDTNNSTQNPRFDANLKVILHNLRLYQPFLPSTLLETLHEDSPIINQREKSYHIFNEARLQNRAFASKKGTIIVINLGLCTVCRERVAKALDYFLSFSLPTIKRYGGIADSIEGPHIVISFNFHSSVLHHEDAATRCAVAIYSRMARTPYNKIAIGIVSGMMLVGTVGNEQQRARIVVGEGVDLAHKLVTYAQMVRVPIVATKSVQEATKLPCFALDIIRPRWYQTGRSSAVFIYEVRPGINNIEKKLVQERHALDMALRKVSRGLYKEAIGLLSPLAQSSPQAARLLSICRESQKQPQKALENQLAYSREEQSWEYVEALNKDITSPTLANLSEKAEEREIQERVAVFQRLDERMRRKNESRRQKLEEEERKRENEDENDAPISLFAIVLENSDDDKVSSSADDTDREDLAENTFRANNGEVYTLTEQELGSGQFGQVVLGMNQEGRFVAIKKMPISGDFSTDILNNEEQTLNEMRHENIAAYVSSGVYSTYYCLVMEYLSAGSIRRMIGEMGAIPFSAARVYLRDILKGLEYLHDKGITHCDIKPDNVLFTGDGTCKLADFGTAKVNRVEDEKGRVRGTPRYMAPEAAMGEWDAYADVYSVGITFVEMVTGRNPWHEVRGDDTAFLMKLRQRTISPTIPGGMPTTPPTIPAEDDESDEARDLFIQAFAYWSLQYEPKARKSVSELLKTFFPFS